MVHVYKMDLSSIFEHLSGYNFEFLIRVLSELQDSTSNWLEFASALCLHIILYFNLDLVEQHLELYHVGEE